MKPGDWIILAVPITILVGILVLIIIVQWKCIWGNHDEQRVDTPFGGFYKCRRCNKRL